MNFLKKNCFALIMLAALLAGVVLVGILVINALAAQGATASAVAPLEDFEISALSAGLFINLAILISLLGVMAYIVLRMFEINKIANIVLTAAGILALIFFIIGFVNSTAYLNALKDGMEMAETLGKEYQPYQAALFNYNNQLFSGIIELIVFAVLPIVYGAKKLVYTQE